jgi:uncharacterized protein YoxC
METRDNVIESGLKTIEAKINSLVKPIENYSFKTNCRYGDINIKTQSINSLMTILSDLYIRKYAIKSIFEDFASLDKKYKNNYKLYDFTLNEWVDDVSYLIGKLEYNEKLKDLTNKADKLKNYYSDDRQADIAVQDIINSL